MNLLLDAWPHWLRPYWLLLAPLLGWLLWKLLHRQRRAGRWQLLLPTAFQPWLLVGGAGRQNRMPWICLGIAWLLALLALLGPSWQQLEQPSMKRSDPLVAILQLTPGCLPATCRQPAWSRPGASCSTCFARATTRRPRSSSTPAARIPWCRCRTTSSPRATCSTP